MNSKSPIQDENFFRKIVRAIVNEELKIPFESLQSNILRAIDGRNTVLSESIDKKNYDLRSDIAKMKDEIMGELETARQEQTILSGQHGRILDHDQRLDKLEKIYPQSQHASL